MNRRHFLAAAASLPFAPAWAMEFESFRRAREQERAAFNDTQGSEFSTYQRELQTAFQAYRDSYANAVQARQRELSVYWRDAELSSQTRWVEYSEDKAIQRTVDFETNRITLRLRPEAGGADARLVRRELATLLGTEVAQAASNDPVSVAVEKAVRNAAPHSALEGEGEHRLVLGELFGQQAPSGRQIQEVAERLAGSATTTSDNGVVTVSVPLPASRPAQKAQGYAARVRPFAQKWRVEPALVLAVMHTESAFNPLARSPVPAYGLMQIVPGSAGKDATELVYGKARVVTPSYLYDAERNIQLGVAYLHLLQERYLRAITHPESRLYCAIAAYNTGAGNVARSYTGTTNINKAAEQINRLSPKANFEHMRARLPYEETRNYLQRVASRLPGYRSL